MEALFTLRRETEEGTTTNTQHTSTTGHVVKGPLFNDML